MDQRNGVYQARYQEERQQAQVTAMTAHDVSLFPQKFPNYPNRAATVRERIPVAPHRYRSRTTADAFPRCGPPADTRGGVVSRWVRQSRDRQGANPRRPASVPISNHAGRIHPVCGSLADARGGVISRWGRQSRDRQGANPRRPASAPISNHAGRIHPVCGSLADARGSVPTRRRVRSETRSTAALTGRAERNLAALYPLQPKRLLKQPLPRGVSARPRQTSGRGRAKRDPF